MKYKTMKSPCCDSPVYKLTFSYACSNCGQICVPAVVEEDIKTLIEEALQHGKTVPIENPIIPDTIVAEHMKATQCQPQVKPEKRYMITFQYTTFPPENKISYHTLFLWTNDLEKLFRDQERRNPYKYVTVICCVEI